MIDAGPPLGLIAVGLVLWLAVNAAIAGISIHAIGLILVLVGVVWLLIELAQGRGWRRRETIVRDRPVVRERDVY
jgi:thiosulfate reductase cytochrome b subunit